MSLSNGHCNDCRHLQAITKGDNFMPVFLRKIRNEKRGNGIVCLSMVILILIFISVFVIINLLHLYLAKNKLQLVGDTIADGAAVAGLNPQGFSETDVIHMAHQILEKNRNNDSKQNPDYMKMHIEKINVKAEKDSDNQETGNYIVRVDMKATLGTLATNLLNLSDKTHIKTSSTVLVKPKEIHNMWLQSSFVWNQNDNVPFTTTYPGKRNPQYVNWFIFNYLHPSENPLYHKNVALKEANGWFLGDYFKCLGYTVEAPIERFEKNHQYYGNRSIQKTTDFKFLSDIAQTGRPAVIICNNPTRDVYIVLPFMYEFDQEGKIAVACIGKNASCYKHIPIDQFSADNATGYYGD